MFCTECDLLGKGHLLAFDRYKVMTLDYSLSAGFIDDEERHTAVLEAIDQAREECDAAMVAMVAHARSHRVATTNVVCMPKR